MKTRFVIDKPFAPPDIMVTISRALRDVGVTVSVVGETSEKVAFVLARCDEQPPPSDVETLRCALTNFVEGFEDPNIREVWELNNEYVDACEALGREPKDIG